MNGTSGHNTIGQRQSSVHKFCPNIHFLPNIWAEINRFLSKSTLFTPHLGKNRLFSQIYYVSLHQDKLHRGITLKQAW